MQEELADRNKRRGRGQASRTLYPLVLTRNNVCNYRFEQSVALSSISTELTATFSASISLFLLERRGEERRDPTRISLMFTMLMMRANFTMRL